MLYMSAALVLAALRAQIVMQSGAMFLPQPWAMRCPFAGFSSSESLVPWPLVPFTRWGSAFIRVTV
jgi:hypothetical protein